MVATLCFTPLPFRSQLVEIRAKRTVQSCYPLYAKPKHSVSRKSGMAEFGRTDLCFLNRTSLSRASKKLSICASDQLRSDSLEADAVDNSGAVPLTPENGDIVPNLYDTRDSSTWRPQSKTFRNRFLDFVRIGSVVNSAAESFFKSEIRRRLFITGVLIVISRVGYYVPLPGFDRRLIPRDYLSFVSGSVEELGDFTSELKLSFFQLGISPQILASILMQVLCHVVPSLVKLRKEGLDGHEKIKSYIWWISLGFAIFEGVIVACYSLPYSIYAASNR